MYVWISTWGLIEFVDASFNISFMLWLGNHSLSLVSFYFSNFARKKWKVLGFFFLIEQQQNIYHFLYCVMCVCEWVRSIFIYNAALWKRTETKLENIFKFYFICRVFLCVYVCINAEALRCEFWFIPWRKFSQFFFCNTHNNNNKKKN